MPRPSFQFYPADWRGNAKLRRCSLAARGAWMEILSVLHDSDEYGIARYPLVELAAAAGVKTALARELVTKGVLKGSDTDAVSYVYRSRHAGKEGPPISLLEANAPCWYSSRMVRDEWVRQQRGRNTRFSDENPPPNAAPKAIPTHSPKPHIGGQSGDGPSSSSSSSSSVLPKGSTAADAAPPGPRLVHPAPAKSADDKAALYSEMREVCGQDTGALATQLLAVCDGNLLRARGLVHDARGKLDGKVWLVSIIRRRTTDEGVWGLTGMV